MPRSSDLAKVHTLQVRKRAKGQAALPCFLCARLILYIKKLKVAPTAVDPKELTEMLLIVRMQYFYLDHTFNTESKEITRAAIRRSSYIVIKPSWAASPVVSNGGGL